MRVRLRNGEAIERFETTFRGSAGNRPGWLDIEEKVAGLLGADRAKQLAAGALATDLTEALCRPVSATK